MPKISIIVPLYKAERYLRRCVESIIHQTYTDWELLLIDDGSPDGSGRICDEYADGDARIRVFHKENGGVSSARNLGLENVHGEYVTFVDSDDMIDTRTLDICISQCELFGLDMLQFSFSRNVADLGSAENFEPGIFTNQEYVKKTNLLKCVWGTVVRSNILHRNHIKFDEEMKLAEDQLFVFSCIEQSKKIMRIPNVLYYYYDNPSSATNNEQYKDLINSSYKCITFKENHPLFACQIDDLVLFFIEKLIVNGKYSVSYTILSKLKPDYSDKRPWPSRVIVKLSQFNGMVGFYLGAPLYNIYYIFMKLLSNIKRWSL